MSCAAAAMTVSSDARRPPATLPGPLEQAHGGGRGQVQRLGASWIGTRTRVGERGCFGREPPCLVAEEERDRSRQIELEQVGLAVGSRGVDRASTGSQLREDGLGRGPTHDRDVEQRARRRPHRLRVVQVDGLGGEHDGVGSGGIGGAKHRARVPRVTNRMQDRDAARRFGDLGQLGVEEPGDPHEALRRHRGRELRHHLLVDVHDLGASARAPAPRADARGRSRTRWTGPADARALHRPPARPRRGTAAPARGRRASSASRLPRPSDCGAR